MNTSNPNMGVILLIGGVLTGALILGGVLTGAWYAAGKAHRAGVGIRSRFAHWWRVGREAICRLADGLDLVADVRLLCRQGV